MNTLNGYSKSTLTDNNVLTASGGHKAVGNTNGNIPLNNGTLNTNLNADMLDGRHRSNLFTSLQEWVTADKNTFSITVDGDKDTYYPVIINSTASKHLPNIITIFKNLGSPSASYITNHSNGTFSMLYRYEVRYTGWDGNNGYVKTLMAVYSYTPSVAHTSCDAKNNGGLIIWLRGGGNQYTISATYPISKSETIDGVTKTVLKGNIYYEKTEISSDFYVEPKNEIDNAGIYNNITNCFGNALTATKADKATLADRATTVDKITYKTITSNFDTQYRTQTKGDNNGGWYLSVIRNDTSGITTSPKYGTGLAFGLGDTHSYLYTSYSDPLAYIGGGNVNKLNWIKQLVFTDGTGASGNWNITSANSNKLDGLYSYQYFRQLGTNADINSFGDDSNNNGIIYINTTTPETINAPFKYGSILSLNIGAASWMIACQSNGKLLFRDRWWSEATTEEAGQWSDWKELAFKSDIPTTSTLDSRYVKKSGDTMSGNLEISNSNGGTDLGTKIIGKTNSIGFIIGSDDVNRGIYDYTNARWILYQDDTNTNLNSHTKFNSGITVTSAAYFSRVTTTGQVIIKGTAADKPLVVRGIVGYDGSANIAELYLQYGADKAIHLGNTGAYTISKDGGTYSGAAAKLSVNGGSTSKPVYFANGVPIEVTSIDNSLINSTNGTSTLSWGTEVTLATIAGQAIKAKLPSNPNSDTKVTQIPTTINGYRPIVLSNLNNNGETTNSVYTTNFIQVNPSNGVLQITGSGGLNIKGSEKEGGGYNDPPQIKFMRGTETDDHVDWAIAAGGSGFRIRYKQGTNSWIDIFKTTTGNAYIYKPLSITGGLSLTGALTSTVATGTAPLSIISTTKVNNLNADLLDGYHASSFVQQTDLKNQINELNVCYCSKYSFWSGSSAGTDNINIEHEKGLQATKITKTSNTATFEFSKNVLYARSTDPGTNVSIIEKSVKLTITGQNSEGYYASQGELLIGLF